MGINTTYKVRENFIETITIDSLPYIFRFTFNNSEEVYQVSVVNLVHIIPFTMAQVEECAWKIIGNVPSNIKAVESLLSKMIVSG